MLTFWEIAAGLPRAHTHCLSFTPWANSDTTQLASGRMGCLPGHGMLASNHVQSCVQATLDALVSDPDLPDLPAMQNKFDCQLTLPGGRAGSYLGDTNCTRAEIGSKAHGSLRGDSEPRGRDIFHFRSCRGRGRRGQGPDMANGAKLRTCRRIDPRQMARLELRATERSECRASVIPSPGKHLDALEQ